MGKNRWYHWIAWLFTIFGTMETISGIFYKPIFNPGGFTEYLYGAILTIALILSVIFVIRRGRPEQ